MLGTVEEQKLEIEEAIKKAARDFLFKSDNPETRHTLAGRLRQIVAEHLRDRSGGYWSEEIQLEIGPGSEPNQMIIKPTNLFTLLVLHGIYVNPVQLAGETRWETETFIFECVDGEPKAWLKQNLYVLEFTIKEAQE